MTSNSKDIVTLLTFFGIVACTIGGYAVAGVAGAGYTAGGLLLFTAICVALSGR